jgi:hypothetical protein
MAENLKELRSYQELQSARQWLWGWIVFLVLFLYIWQWPSLTMIPLEHTYLLSSPTPGSLISDWWSIEHFFSLFLMLLWLIPLTLAFALECPLRNWRRTLHLITTFIFFLITVFLLFWWAVQYEAANDATAANSRNPANDPRWCCVNFSLDPQRCVPLSPTNLCNPGPGQADLVVAPMFVYRFWFLVVFMLLIILDFFVMVKGIFERAVSRYNRDVFGGGGAIDDEAEAAPAAAEKPRAPAGVFSFSVPVPASYGSDGKPNCPVTPSAPPLNVKDQLRAVAARQQLLIHQSKNGGDKQQQQRYNGKNSKR